MKYRFVLNGETPAKKNSRRTLRNGKTIPSARFMAWHNDADFQLACQKSPETPIKEPISIKMVFYHWDYSKRDSDNSATSILDLLRDNCIIYDDNWQIIRQIHIENHYEKNNAHCEIILSDYKEKE